MLEKPKYSQTWADQQPDCIIPQVVFEGLIFIAGVAVGFVVCSQILLERGL